MSPPMPRKSKMGLLKSLFTLLDRRIRSIESLRRIAQRKLEPFPVSVTYAGFCNGRRLVRVLRQLEPDYIIMMGGGILSAEVIQTAGKGVLNAHPGLIPWLRGVDVIRWALLRDVAIGVTGHFIDTGIDTGPVVCRYLLPIESSDTYEDLKARAEDLTVATMLSMIRKVWEGEDLSASPQNAKSKLCQAMPPTMIAEVDALIGQGKALKLRNEWAGKEEDIEGGEHILADYYCQD